MRARLRTAVSRLRGAFRHRADDDALRSELDAHLAMREADLTAQGVQPEAARRQARLELGPAGALREAHRDLRGLPLTDALGRDIRDAWRSLRRDASVTASALVILGLGIGASAIVFSVINTLVIRPLPFADAGRLVWIANGVSDNLSEQTTQVSNLLDLTARSETLSAVAGFSPFYGVGDVRLTDGDSSERVTEVAVTQGFFPLLGLQPHLGRLFLPEEALGASPKSVVITHAFWRRHFAEDRAIIGRTIHLDGQPAIVVGVLPASFDFASVFAPGTQVEIFSPLPLTHDTDRRGNVLALIGRLTDGATVESAEQEAAAIAASLPFGRVSDDMWRNKFTPRLSALQTRVSGSFRYALAVLGAAGILLLLLVSANISGLLLAKGATRRREMAIRAALGAGRPQLIRQLLVESALIAAAGALMGVGVAFFGLRALAGLQGAAIPMLKDIHLDAATGGCLCIVTSIIGLTTGLLPGLQASRTQPSDVLSDASRGSTSGTNAIRRALVIIEVALVCVMLTSAVLLTRSLLEVLKVHPGFDARGVLTVRIDPGPAFRAKVRRGPYFDDVVAAVRALPEVEAAGVTDALPFGNNFGWRRWDAKTADTPEVKTQPLIRMVDSGYFAAMRIPVADGRPFTQTDDATAEPLAIVNEALARMLWPSGHAVGRTLFTSGVARRVVGVVGEARYFSLERSSGPEMYMPIRQTGDFRVVNLVIRSHAQPAGMAAALRAAVARVDPSVPVADVKPLEELLDQTVFPRRSVAMLVLGFAVFGAALAALGLYSVIAYSVHQRRAEIAIRLALGAQPRAVRARVLADTLRLAVVGMAVGLPSSWLAGWAIRGLLFGVERADAVTIVGVFITLSLVATLAGIVPARRAARVDAMKVLRSS